MENHNHIDILDKNNKSDISLNISKAQARAEKTNNLIEVIRVNQPISLWDLEKITKIPHSTLFYILRDLEFANVVYSKLKINEFNRAVRIFYTAKKEELKWNYG